MVDPERQDAMNLLLGLFVPVLGKPAIWDIDQRYLQDRPAVDATLAAKASYEGLPREAGGVEWRVSEDDAGSEGEGDGTLPVGLGGMPTLQDGLVALADVGVDWVTIGAGEGGEPAGQGGTSPPPGSPPRSPAASRAGSSLSDPGGRAVPSPLLPGQRPPRSPRWRPFRPPSLDMSLVSGDASARDSLAESTSSGGSLLRSMHSRLKALWGRLPFTPRPSTGGFSFATSDSDPGGAAAAESPALCARAGPGASSLETIQSLLRTAKAAGGTLEARRAGSESGAAAAAASGFWQPAGLGDVGAGLGDDDESLERKYVALAEVLMEPAWGEGGGM